jgi:hypothetical protein
MQAPASAPSHLMIVERGGAEGVLSVIAGRKQRFGFRPGW